jgi:hypothetical protein
VFTGIASAADRRITDDAYEKKEKKERLEHEKREKERNPVKNGGGG